MMDTPHNEHVELEAGGDLHLIRFGDGQIRLSIEDGGTRYSRALTVKDVRRLRLAAGGVILADHVAGVTP